jgi:DNA topoisomerase-1
MKYLAHNGILFPKRYEPKGFSILIKGKEVKLTPNQEEMAVAWVKKLGTEYAQDEVFRKNFFGDFRKALGVEGDVKPEEFDFNEIESFVQKEKEAKLNMPKEEKKRLAAERKVEKEKNKEKYGYATIDGVRVEIGAYMAEPSSIFMGRGGHPLRGKWKPGPRPEDVTLNLSKDAPMPEGKWKGRDWQENSMWVAKWDDKLRGKEKYIWVADTSNIKQEKEKAKFDKAEALKDKIGEVTRHINDNLKSSDIKRRKVATVAYLIDALKLRVGDEKDPDEADTVGATTLRPEHIKFEANGVTTFDFLGKDCVRWVKQITLPKTVVDNLKEFSGDAKSTIFEGVSGEKVTEFFNEVILGLTAKVFRTFHASNTVEDELWKTKVSKSSEVYEKKFAATMANLDAAIVCNHKRKPPKNWEESLAKKEERLKNLKAKATESAKKKAKELEYKIKAVKETRDYNLGTSLKSYIDPRIYYDWGKKVDFDWKLYYPKTLQRKFSWVESNAEHREY